MKPMRSTVNVPGLGEAFFNAIAQLVGSAPEEAIRVARKWRAFQKSADRPDFVLRGKAATLRVEGKWAASAQAFLEAGRISKDPVSRQSFQIGAIDSYARAGKPEEGIALGRRIARALRKLKEPILAARATLNVGNALVWQDRYGDAAKEYRRALESLEAPFEVAVAKLGLSTGLLFSGDPLESAVLAQQARTLFHELGLETYAHQCEINIAHVAILQGRFDDAWEILRQVRDVLTSPPDRARIEEFLGDVFLALNLYEDALEHYTQAEKKVGDMLLNRANCSLGIGRTQSALQNAGEATKAFDRAIRLYSRASNAPWEAVARLERARVTGRLAQVRESTKSLGRLRVPFWEAQGLLLLAENGDQSALHSARQIIEKRGYVGLRWKADWLAARASQSLDDYRQMATAIVADRALSRSLAARAGYMRDKRAAFQDFFARLVEIGTPEALQETVSWVSQTRSVALIDEIVAAPQFAPIRAALERLRVEISTDPIKPGGTRRASRQALDRVPELLDRRAPGTQAVERTGQGSIWLDMGQELACIEGGTVKKVSSRCIKETLQWLEFEMMVPMTHRSASSQPCERLLDDLREGLGTDHSLVCPDGTLWQVPWALLGDREPLITLSPQFGGGPDPILPADARVAIWMHKAADLPAVSREVDAILECFPHARVCRTAAEARASLSESFDYVHVSTHARVNGRNPMFSYFEFSDGPLYAVEISRSQLSVGLAVLAACDTGRFQLSLPDEPDGFVRAFLARGAGNVIAGLWPLDDEAAYVTIAPLVRSLKSGDTVREALSEARQVCRKRFSHPYFWGPLTLFAGYNDASK